jgi:hypothetical protein
MNEREKEKEETKSRVLLTLDQRFPHPAVVSTRFSILNQPRLNQERERMRERRRTKSQMSLCSVCVRRVLAGRSFWILSVSKAVVLCVYRSQGNTSMP